MCNVLLLLNLIYVSDRVARGGETGARRVGARREVPTTMVTQATSGSSSVLGQSTQHAYIGVLVLLYQGKQRRGGRSLGGSRGSVLSKGNNIITRSLSLSRVWLVYSDGINSTRSVEIFGKRGRGRPSQTPPGLGGRLRLHQVSSPASCLPPITHLK